MNYKDDILYNKRVIVIIPTISLEYLEELKYTFGDVIIFDNTKDLNLIINFINKNNFEQVILVDYQLEYYDIISSLKNKNKIKMIFTKSMGAFSNPFIYSLFKGILGLYSEFNIDKIGFLDRNLYETLKNKNIDCCHIILDVCTRNNDEKFNERSIGLLNNDKNPRHSFYNELSALKFKDYYASLYKPSKTTKKFMKLFDIKYVNQNEKENIYKNNLVNLYINFTDNNNTTFIKSMDNNVPCILGNNELLSNNRYLNSMLVVESDDSVDEISQKIELVKKNREKILIEYKKFREDYSKKSKKTINDFLCFDLYNEKNIDSKSNDLLLTVVVPVYNTEKYLEKCLKSILSALPNRLKKQSEILIINDGSKDSSEQIILKYKNKYPRLINYIKQKNHGLGNVRNVALKNANGKYIASIDSDDTINRLFFKESIEYMNENIDIIIYDWVSITDTSRFDTPAIEWVFNDINKYEGLLYTTIMPSTCNKIIKKELYDNLNIKFMEDKYEDLSTNPFIMLSAKTIKYINKPYYEYYIRSNSIMRSSAGYSMIDVLKEVDNRLKKYIEYVNVDIDKFKFYTYSWRIEEFIFNQLYELNGEDLEKFIKYVYDNLYKIITNIFDSKYYQKLLDSLDKNMKNYLIKRNMSFKEKKLLRFIKENKNDKYKLNAYIVYYGKKKSSSN